MKARGLISWCVMLLWFVATHHCAFERLISDLGERPFSQNSTPYSDSSSQSDCPSHPSGDSSSHSEGKTCSTLFQLSSSSQLLDATKATPVPLTSSLLAVLSNSLGYLNPFLSGPTAPFDIADSAALSQCADSLSIAPNAPPITLA